MEHSERWEGERKKVEYKRPDTSVPPSPLHLTSVRVEPEGVSEGLTNIFLTKFGGKLKIGGIMPNLVFGTQETPPFCAPSLTRRDDNRKEMDT